ncbi:hypothetical protein T09_10842 [Trichinella sp. T9]|nr:hypothetical protein T09_10842 [Trichinella sp. T9]
MYVGAMAEWTKPVCIFKCMTTRAVHQEFLIEQTTDSFLQGLRRFISRRVRPRVIQSDNFRVCSETITGKNCSASSMRNVSGGNSSHPEPLGAAVTGKDSSVLSRMRYERQFEEPSSNMTSSTLFSAKSKHASTTAAGVHR